MDNVFVVMVSVVVNVMNVKQISGVIQMKNATHVNVIHMVQHHINVIVQLVNVHVNKVLADINVMFVIVVTWAKHHIVHHVVNVLIIGISF